MIFSNACLGLPLELGHFHYSMPDPTAFQMWVWISSLPLTLNPPSKECLSVSLFSSLSVLSQTCSNEVKCICDRDYTGKDCSVFDPIPEPTAPAGLEKKGPEATLLLSLYLLCPYLCPSIVLPSYLSSLSLRVCVCVCVCVWCV